MAKRVTIVVTLILIAINMQLFFIFETRALPNGLKYCHLVNVPLDYLKIYIKLDYTVNSYFPFSIMVLTNGAIIYKFMRASCARHQGETESTNQALSKSANKGTAMLITVSITFIILTGPLAVVDNDRTINVDQMMYDIFSFLRLLNQSINAVLYCIVGSRFRNELMTTFPFLLCQKETNNPPGRLPDAAALAGIDNPAGPTADFRDTANQDTSREAVNVTASPSMPIRY